MNLITTPEAMHIFGKQLASRGSHILLFGAMGSGKTTLTKGFAEALDIDPHTVQSPTYTYVNIYDEKILHIDMRRIEQKDQFFDLGILEMIDTYPYVIIERPKRIDQYASYPWKHITITQAETGRTITVA